MSMKFMDYVKAGVGVCVGLKIVNGLCDWARNAEITGGNRSNECCETTEEKNEEDN